MSAITLLLFFDVPKWTILFIIQKTYLLMQINHVIKKFEENN